MKQNRIYILIAVVTIGITSCKKKQNNFDASGSFEAVETMISAETAGTLKEFNLEEGQTLDSGSFIGYIDSTQLYLKKKQLISQINAVKSRTPNISVQIATLEEQLATANRERNRIKNLLNAGAGTTKQLDDVNSTIAMLQKQIEAQKSSLEISKDGLSKDANALQIQIEQLNDQLSKCKIINPVNGVVLTKYVETNEMLAPGKVMYKIANLSNIILRAYITSDQLPIVKLNQIVKVNTDDGKGGFTTTEGKLIWINDKAEFTPKTIQTKSERANMVYAIKVKVKNDGRYKIGMYGEINF